MAMAMATKASSAVGASSEGGGDRIWELRGCASPSSRVRTEANTGGAEEGPKEDEGRSEVGAGRQRCGDRICAAAPLGPLRAHA